MIDKMPPGDYSNLTWWWRSNNPYRCSAKGCPVCDQGLAGQEAKAEAPVAPPATFEERVVALAKVLLDNAPISERISATPEFRYKWGDALLDATDIIIASEFEETCTCD